MNRVRDARYPTGWANIPVPELHRRHSHLSLVAKTHPMLRLSKDCLNDTDTERPSAQQICRCLSTLKEAPQYAQSLEGRGGEREGGERVALVEGGREGREREGEAQEREELIRQLREENHAREREVREKERKVENIRLEVRVKEGENETLRGMVGEREREVREKEREVENLRGEIRVKERDN